MAGQGTVGLEMLEDEPDLDIRGARGGGGLVAALPQLLAKSVKY